MEKSLTLVEEKRSVKKMRPRRSVINALLNYSKSLEVMPSRYGFAFLVNNN